MISNFQKVSKRSLFHHYSITPLLYYSSCRGHRFLNFSVGVDVS